MQHPDGTFDTRIFNWNHRFITEERGVLTFLAERLMQSPTRAEEEARLLEIVFASRGHSEWVKAASTAITVLNAARFNFNTHTRIPNHDLSDIQIPYADLTQGLLAFIDLSGADVSYGNFHDAVLVGANVSNANLTGTRFLAGDSFILSDDEVKVMIPHPNRPDVVIYGDKNDIVIARLSDGVVEKRLTGHTDSVTSLAFSQDKDNKLKLASGSRDKTIRIWDITLENPHLKTLEGHTKSVESLIFTPDNHWLISGSDKEIFIWNAQNWKAAPYRLPFSARTLVLHGNLLSISHNNAVHTIDLGDFPNVLPQTFRWVMAAPPTFWLQSCNIIGAKGIGLSTKKLLQNEGAIEKADEPILALNTAATTPSFANNPQILFADKNVAGNGLAAARALKSPRVVEPSSEDEFSSDELDEFEENDGSSCGW